MKHEASFLRRLVAWIILATMLFARVAAAAYVCPMDTQASAPQGVFRSVECWDLEQPTLCADYRHNDRTIATPDGHPTDGDLPPVLILSHFLPSPQVTAVPRRPAQVTEAKSEPIYLMTARLRN